MDFTRNLTARLEAAETYVPETASDERQMRQLILHRQIMLNYSRLIDRAKNSIPNTKTVVNNIQTHIDRLSKANATDVVRNGQGRASFAVPGGSFEHAISYEFVRENDGTYSFIIYNKGEEGTDPDLHGKVLFVKDNQFLTRTRVQIRGLKKEQLQNSAFLQKLVDAQHHDKSMKPLYACIKQSLLAKGSGWVRKAPLESEWVALRGKYSPSQINRRVQIEQQLLNDPDFHPIQASGTCAESNSQTMEHFILDPLLRKKLKLHSLEIALSRLGEEIHETPELKKRVLLKIAQLEQKIFQVEGRSQSVGFIAPRTISWMES